MNMSTRTLISVEEYLRSSYEPDCDFVDGEIEERNVGELNHSVLQLRVGAYLLAQYGKTGATVATECRIRVKPGRVRIPDICFFLTKPDEQVPTKPPLICIEVLSPEDRMSRVQIRTTGLPPNELNCSGASPCRKYSTAMSWSGR